MLCLFKSLFSVVISCNKLDVLDTSLVYQVMYHWNNNAARLLKQTRLFQVVTTDCFKPSATSNKQAVQQGWITSCLIGGMQIFLGGGGALACY